MSNLTYIGAMSVGGSVCRENVSRGTVTEVNSPNHLSGK